MPVTAIAKLKYVSIPPRKMRLVANMVKGMPVEKALDILNFTPRVAAEHMAKTLKSATANALSQEGTAHLKPEALHIKQILVDPAPSAKRIRFRAMGRADRYIKRHCHLTIVIEDRAEGETIVDAAARRKVSTEKGSEKKKSPTRKTPAKKKTAAKKTTKKTARKTAKKTTTAKSTKSSSAKKSTSAAKKTTVKKTSAKPKKD